MFGNSSLVPASVLPIYAYNKTIGFSSDNTSIARVVVDTNNANRCTVTAIGPGNTTIKAISLDGNIVGSTSVRVLVPATNISTTTKITLVKGNSTRLNSVILPRNTTDQRVRWTSNKTSIATVDQNGLVKGISAGIVDIYVTTVVGGLRAKCTVTVTQSVDKVTLNKTVLNLKKGSKFNLKATVLPTNAKDKRVTWKSSNTSIAKVDSNDVVTFIKEGKANILVTTVDNKRVAVCKVTVYN